MGDYATGLATDLIYGHMKRECHQSGRGMPTFHLWSFEKACRREVPWQVTHLLGRDRIYIRLANVRVLSEALVGADRQKPLVGVSISVCLVFGCSY